MIKNFNKFNFKTILYLHGLDATPEKDNIQIFKKDNIKIISPYLDYREKPLFNDISSIIIKEKPDGIIGHSIGGYLSYYLSIKFYIPCLMFNPAFNDNDLIFQPLPINIYDLTPNINQIALIGSEDDVIPMKDQINGLKNNKNIKIFIEKIGHDIPDVIKLKYFTKFINIL